MRHRGLAFKLAALILSCATLILALILGESYQTGKRLILKNVEQNAGNLAEAAVYRIETVLTSVQKVAENIAFSLENADPSRADVEEIVVRVVERNPEIYGSAIAFEPFTLDPHRLYFAPYAYRAGDPGDEHEDVLLTHLGGHDYRYFHHDWYQLPKELDRAAWTEPYYDEGGGRTLMATHAVPFHSLVEGRLVFRGVVTADIALDWLRDVVASVKFSRTGYGFLISRQGAFLTHKDESLVMNETIFTQAEALGWPRLREIGQAMVRGESALTEFRDPLTGMDAFWFYAPLPSAGWALGVVIPKAELLADITRLHRIMLATGGAGFLVLLVVIVLIARSITRPLNRLTNAAVRIAGGDLDAGLPQAASRDEVGELTDAFGHMRDALKEYIRELTATTKAKERIEAELRIARDIQMGILPKLFPPFPERTEFDIYATIEPAREVGGDLYDFFFIDPDHFCFLIGDVSGKGVPAAFFMAVTRTLLKVTAEHAHDPGAILTRVNNDLASDNESCMFVTLFCAVVELSSGTMRYASAGHNPPVLLPRDGPPLFLPPRNEPVAGAMEGVEYTTDERTLLPGEAIFLYTDGVTEAMDQGQDLYGEERLMAEAARLSGRTAEEIIDTLDGSVRAFTGGAEQSDDITMLALRYRGPDAERDET